MGQAPSMPEDLDLLFIPRSFRLNHPSQPTSNKPPVTKLTDQNIIQKEVESDDNISSDPEPIKAIGENHQSTNPNE